MRNNILITSAGQRVSLVRAFQAELKKFDKNNKVYTVDSNPVLAPACHVSDGHKKLPKVTANNYITKLLNLCKEWKIKLIVPTIDTELLTLSKNVQYFKEKGIKIVVADEDFVQACRDKRIINKFFLKKEIEIPRQIDKEKPTFPLFIKPYDGSLSKDIFLIKTKDELKDYHLKNSKFMFMEYMSPDEYNEYTVDTYYSKSGDLRCVVPRKRIYVRAGEVNKGVTHKNEIVDFVKQKLMHIKGAKGCLTMQFFLGKENKRIVGIEINPRFGGGYPLSYLAGANFPKWLIEEYIFDKEIDYYENWEENLLMLRYDDEVLVSDYEY